MAGNIYNEFATAAYRFGHSLVTDELWSVNAAGQRELDRTVSLRDAFFNPSTISEDNALERLLRGAAAQPCEKLDMGVVETLRSFLFGSPATHALDLVALNIQRGRDHGLPSCKQRASRAGAL